LEPLIGEAQVTKMLKKYGRTFHLPISPGASSDDKILDNDSALRTAAEVVVTEKMDGENTTILSKGCHPRSPDAGYHPSRDWVKAFAASISPLLDDSERIVGEYLYARHSIAYDSLESYFLGFAWIVDEEIQSWDQTGNRFRELGIISVPVLYRGPFTDEVINSIIRGLDLSRQEGFVVRSTASFPEDQMDRQLAKYVRLGHVESETHWTKGEIIQNGLAKHDSQ